MPCQELFKVCKDNYKAAEVSEIDVSVGLGIILVAQLVLLLRLL